MSKTIIKIQKTELLSNNWYLLNKVTYNYQKEDNTVETHIREVYDRGNGAAILLYNSAEKTVILTRQFRLPTYLNGNKTGMMIEVCADFWTKIIQSNASFEKQKKKRVIVFR